MRGTQTENEIVIKFLTRGASLSNSSIYQRQTPHNEGRWGNCRFVFNPLERRYDWLVVFDDVPYVLPGRVEHLQCPKENTILVTSEPSSISYYGKAFANQFGYLITSHSAKRLSHPNALRGQTGIYWLYGKDFDAIVQQESIPKTKKLSAIISNKREGHTMHKKRFDFAALLEKEVPQFERFGRGFRFVEKKYEAIDPYEFHLVIENHIEEHMWSEKLADAFLGFSVPIYCGAPNIYDYFPKESLIQIDIDRPKEAIEIIKEVLNTPGEYERRFAAVKEARRRVIYEYNLIAMICKIANSAPKRPFTPGQKIYSRRFMRALHPRDLLGFTGFRIANFFKDIANKIAD